jgi:hypothetical protein
MSDERFDRDLADVLREIAGEEAPMSLRNRLSDITERAPMGRRLWFATPMRLGMVAATAVAVLALAIIFFPREEVGPSPSDNPSPSASVAPTPSVEPSVAPTTEPTPVPTAVPTAMPTATPLSEWTGLVWSDPVTPSFTVHLYDLLPWGDGYVAVGEVDGSNGQGDAAFLTSPDGLNWTVAHRVEPGFGRIPRFLVALGDELFAFSRPQMDALPNGNAYGHVIWRSTDGTSWSEVDSPSWRDAWSDARMGPMPSGWDITQWEVSTGLVDVASGPSGMVAIGNSFSDQGTVPIILSSADGQSWSSASLPADSPSAMLSSAEPFAGGTVLVGAIDVGPDPGLGIPAAWFSTDGATWARGPVEGGSLFPEDVTGDFGPLVAGEDGLLTCWGLRWITIGGPRYWIGFVSDDGRAWRAEPDANSSPACAAMAGDGTRIIAFTPIPSPSTGQPWPGVERAWVSTDGVTWAELTVSEVLTDGRENSWVVPDGVIYAGVQSFWFGTPTLAR